MTDPAAAPRLVALVTGATAGIGAAFARRLARDRYDLVLVARDTERLAGTATALHGAYGVEVEVLPADLADPGRRARVEERCAATDRPVDLLVNNAGLTTTGPLHEVAAADEQRLLDVNVTAVLRLTQAALRQMVPRGAGSVLNVSSVAGFAPTASGATYAASKAWVTAFSEGVAGVYGPRGIAVTALCPGFTRTEFHERAEMEVGGIPARLWLSAEEVVDVGLRDLQRGRVVSVPGGQWKAAVALARHSPRGLVGSVGRRVRGS